MPLASARGDHLPNRQAIFQSKRKIPLVMRRHAHHRAIAVAHQHIVAHPQRHRLTGQRMCHYQARIHTGFFFHRQLGFGGAAGFAFLDKRCQYRVA